MNYGGGGSIVTTRPLKNISRVISLPFIIPSFLIAHITKGLDRAITRSQRKRKREYNRTHLVVPALEITVGSRCTLQCIGCANLMQYYGINENKKASDMPLDVIISSVTNFLACVDRIEYLHIIGGEPFLYKELDDVIEFLLQQPKIKRIGITTNGTMIPKGERLISLLQNPNVSINISYYGEEVSKKATELKAFTDEKNITLTTHTNKVWFSFGNMKARNKTEKELNEQFRQCTGCLGLIGYELHYCARGRHGTDLGLVTKRPQDFVDIHTIENMDMKRREIKQYMDRKQYIQACDHCDIYTSSSHSLTPGDQRGTHNIHTLIQ